MKTIGRPTGAPLTLTGDTIETPGPLASPCRIWRWSNNGRGYGLVRINGSRQVAHRVFYEQFCCKIPSGLTLDHLCRNRACVNWEHLEPVPGRENTLRGEGRAAKQARQTHCIHGHKFDHKNTSVWGGHRKCRACESRRRRPKQG